MALEIMKKVQDTTVMDPRVAAILKAKRLKDTATKKYDREEMLENINKITRGEIKPKNTAVPAGKPMKGKMTFGIIDKKGDTIEVSREEFEKKFKKP